MWKRLLVPHDFSRCAAQALDVAVGLAEQGGGQILLVHVSPLPPNLAPDAKVIAPGGDATPVSVDEMLVLGAYRELVAIAMPLEERGLSVLSFARVAESGSPVATILRTAEELDADVIVLGTHGRTGFARLLLGSVAEQIIRRARVPVVSVRAQDGVSHPTREEALAEDELAG